MRNFCCVALLFALLSTAFLAWGADGPKIDALIRQLGADSAEAREEATRQLMKLDEATPALRAALGSKDREVARRARAVLEVLTKRATEVQLRHARADARARRIGLLVERLAGCDAEADDPRCWQPVLDVCRGLRDAFPKQFGKVDWPARSFAHFRAQCSNLQFKASDKRIDLPRSMGGERNKDSTFVVRGFGVVIPPFTLAHLVVSAGPVTPPEGVGSNILTTDSVSGNGEGLLMLMIVSEGDVALGSLLADKCLIVARGSVKCGSIMRNCVVIAGGDITLPENSRNCHFRCCGKANRKLGKYDTDTTLVEKDPRALSCVRFFETKDVGLEVEESNPAVLVTRVSDGPFLKNGLRRNDRVFEVDGTEVGTPEQFRCALRRRVAVGGTATFKVRRDDRWATVRVPMPK